MNSDIQAQWCSKTYEYAAALNSFVERGLREGWENAGEEPKDTGLQQFASWKITQLSLELERLMYSRKSFHSLPKCDRTEPLPKLSAIASPQLWYNY